MNTWQKKVHSAICKLKRDKQLLAAKRALWESPAYALIRKHILKKEPAQVEYRHKIEAIDLQILRILNRYSSLIDREKS